MSPQSSQASVSGSAIGIVSRSGSPSHSWRLLAVYDFIAVFITKHMITLANAAVSKNLSLMIMANEIEAVPLASLSKAELKEYHEAIKGKAKGPISEAVISSGMVPLPARTALGTGDLMAPLILAVSAYTVHLNFTLSFVVVLGFHPWPLHHHVRTEEVQESAACDTLPAFRNTGGTRGVLHYNCDLTDRNA